ncbi:MAG: YCF48-related protein, partial [Terriglobales bacterium]
ADLPLSCYLNRGNDIWAGGQGGTLFHSADGGLTWSRVQPSMGSLTLTSDITSIAATDASVIEVSTSTSERWTTLDGGKSWARK